MTPAAWVAADEFEAMERRAQAAEADWDAATQEGDRLRAEIGRLTTDKGQLREAIGAALDELGVPGREYPAPIVNAVAILGRALQ